MKGRIFLSPFPVGKEPNGKMGQEYTPLLFAHFSVNRPIFPPIFDSLYTTLLQVSTGRHRRGQSLAIFQDHAYGPLPREDHNSDNILCWKARAVIAAPIFRRSTPIHCSRHDERDGRARRRQSPYARTSAKRHSIRL